MSIKLCQHVRENGVFCRSAALRGRRYCYFHTRVLGRRMAMAQARAKGERWRLNLPPLEDMHAVQSALMQVLEAIADDRIDPRRAGLLLYGLQQASGNIKGLQHWLGSDRYEVNPENEGRAVDYPGFEQEFSLPKRLDLTQPPEQAFPPPVAPPKPEQPSMEALQRAYYEAIVKQSSEGGAEGVRPLASPNASGTDSAGPPCRVPPASSHSERPSGCDVNPREVVARSVRKQFASLSPAERKSLNATLKKGPRSANTPLRGTDAGGLTPCRSIG